MNTEQNFGYIKKKYSHIWPYVCIYELIERHVRFTTRLFKPLSDQGGI